MTRKSSLETRNHNRNARGITFILFLIIALPFILLGTTFAVDITRIVSANRDARLMADAATQAAVRLDASGNLSVFSANEAITNFNEFQSRGLGTSFRVEAVSSRLITVDGRQGVLLQIDIAVPNMVIAPYFGFDNNGDAPGSYRIERFAIPCSPVATSASAGCAVPIAG